jgi:transcriptional regulator with XRE-family HTH domain
MAPKRKTALELWGSWFAKARERRMLSQEALAKQTYLSKSTIAMWETGRRYPRLSDLRRCEEALGTDGDLAELLTEWVSREVAQEWLDKWRLIEERATSLWSFETTVVPGLLQTEDYARATLVEGQSSATDEQIEGLLAVRMERQRVLVDGTPPVLVALIAESVLGQTVGGAEVMRDQLLHLAEAAERRDVTVQIVPAGSPVCGGFTGPFVIANFDGGTEVAYVDDQLRGGVVESPDDVTDLRRTFERFRGEALAKRESIERIQRAAEQWTM